MLLAVCPLVGLSGCDSSAARPEKKPNIIWVVWDTARVDRLSLYGHERLTTPHLDRWARGARVFENCVAPGSTTAPSHASMFTGLLPIQHGVSNVRPHLDAAHETIAELLRAGGYATYVYSENPFITKRHNFTQGFDLAEEPSDPKYVERVNRITRERMGSPGQSAEAEGAGTARLRAWVLKAPEVLQQGVADWLGQQDPNRPVFVFLNYMGAHWPRIPAREYRRRLMEPRQVRRSYVVDASWIAPWLYTFGEVEFRQEDIEAMRLKYDAAILELDEHFHRLMQYLESEGRLDNAIVIVTADHGEHLGEHHMMDHQYSVYEPLVRVPLVVWYPARIKAGRDRRPVMLLDLFPTLLELTGLDLPAGLESKAVSLLKPQEQRARLAQYPAASRFAFDTVRRVRPGFDCTPWDRSLRAYYRGSYKLIWGSDGRNELYDLTADPAESCDLMGVEAEVAEGLARELEALTRSLEPVGVVHDPPPELPAMHLERLRALGYAAGQSDDEEREDGVEEGGP